MGKQVIIVGGGATGVSLFSRLSRVAGISTISLIDPNPVGLGTAFGTTDPLLLCNTSVDVTSMDPDGESDLLGYLAARGWPVHRDDFVPRYLIGQYCRERFLERRREAEQAGVRVRHYLTRARSMSPVGTEGYSVELADGRRITGTDVFLCLGLDRPVIPDVVRPHLGNPALATSAYPVEDLSRLSENSRVLILGSKLAAIDAALVLARSRHRVVMASGSGALPAVRTRLRRPKAPRLDTSAWKALSPDSPSLDQEVTRLLLTAVAQAANGTALRSQTSSAARSAERLAEELEIAMTGRAHWQDTIAEIIQVVNHISAGWRHTTRSAVLNRYRHLVARYISAIPVRNARLLLGHLTDGTLSVVPGIPQSVTPVADGKGWQVSWEGSTAERFDHIVCATGYHKPEIGWLPDGTLRLDGAAGTEIDLRVSSELRVCDPLTGDPERIWVLGAASHRRMAIVNYLNTAAHQSKAVAARFDVASSETTSPAGRLT
ncbi:FAD/NAD(P)-binding protein [Streptomyces sp. NPDC058613]|uniref:FAD/NAD(P)-binding protein n=1 Tax=Streptomyces sp. NPDC058613 TaxID=3346556 RepID=UPI00364F0994